MIIWDKNPSDPIVFDERPSSNGWTKESFILALRQQLAGRVEKAFIFGSFATARFTPSSDIDLILIVQSGLPFYERASDFVDLHDLYTPLDILVYRREEFDALLQEASGFWKSVKDSLLDVGVEEL